MNDRLRLSAFQEALRQLREAFVARVQRPCKNALDVRLEAVLSPVITGCHLRASCLSVASCLEKCFRCRFVEPGIIAIRQRDAT